jgi:hypothetical protein
MLDIVIQKVLLILTCSDLQSTAASAVFPRVYLDSIGICQTSWDSVQLQLQQLPIHVSCVPKHKTQNQTIRMIYLYTHRELNANLEALYTKHKKKKLCTHKPEPQLLRSLTTVATKPVHLCSLLFLVVGNSLGLFLEVSAKKRAYTTTH